MLIWEAQTAIIDFLKPVIGKNLTKNKFQTFKKLLMSLDDNFKHSSYVTIHQDTYQDSINTERALRVLKTGFITLEKLASTHKLCCITNIVACVDGIYRAKIDGEIVIISKNDYEILARIMK